MSWEDHKLTASDDEFYPHGRVVSDEDLEKERGVIESMLMLLGVYLVLYPIKKGWWLLVRIHDNDDTEGDGPALH